MADNEETVGQIKASFLSQQSAGPRTPEGKERSKYNAVKHGIFSKVIVLKREPRAVFDALLDGLFKDLHPEGTLAEILVEKLAILLWRYRRLMVAEAKNGETIAAAEEEQEEGEFVSFVETHREREICSDTRPVSSGPSIGHWASLNDFSGYGSDNQCHLQSSWKFLPHRDAILSMDDRSERLVEPGVQEQCS